MWRSMINDDCLTVRRYLSNGYQFYSIVQIINSKCERKWATTRATQHSFLFCASRTWDGTTTGNVDCDTCSSILEKKITGVDFHSENSSSIRVITLFGFLILSQRKPWHSIALVLNQSSEKQRESGKEIHIVAYVCAHCIRIDISILTWMSGILIQLSPNMVKMSPIKSYKLLSTCFARFCIAVIIIIIVFAWHFNQCRPISTFIYVCILINVHET